jgi:hypothetical protein
MPTAAKLFAAVCFGFVGFFAAELAKPAFPEGTRFGWFAVVVAGLGVIVGWRVMGPRAHRAGSMAEAAGSGLTTAVALLFWTFLVFGIREMILRAMNMRFDTVVEALTAVFGIGLEYALILGKAPLAIAVLAVGGGVSGLLAHWGARTFR